MSPIPSTNPASGAAAAAPANTAAAAGQNMFLQLLVAQLKNQDPTQPMDSTTFVTQLAQFQQLESTNNMAASISGIQSDANQLVMDFGSSTATPSAASTNQS